MADNIGMIGLGKLGLPVAVTISQKHTVYGHDIDPSLMVKRTYPHQELGPYLQNNFQEYFDNADLVFCSMEEVLRNCKLVFVSVQTPHDPLYEGVTSLPTERADFNYSYLISVSKSLEKFVTKDHVVVIISTVLPGTLRKYVLPILESKCHVVYNPFFIAMGTVMNDFTHPEFVLLGGENGIGMDRVFEFYKNFYGKDLTCRMSIESAELTKVAYNTFITMKIVYANMLMEMCHKIPGCNVNAVTEALMMGNKRIISPRYLVPGMGDGGSCHPRDNIAMSWLAKEINLSHNIFDDLMMARQHQAEWLVDLMMQYDLPKVILGQAFKPDTRITTGSPAVLCKNLMMEKYGVEPEMFDPHVGNTDFNFGPSVFLLATKHSCFRDLPIPKGSVMIDPHRDFSEQEGVELIRLGAQSPWYV